MLLLLAILSYASLVVCAWHRLLGSILVFVSSIAWAIVCQNADLPAHALVHQSQAFLIPITLLFTHREVTFQYEPPTGDPA